MLLALWTRFQTYPSERGASMVEYALLIVFLALAVLRAAEFLGNATAENFVDLNNEFERIGGGGEAEPPVGRARP